jgi:eukaryotic-like serine/threonine-protein kinase
MTTNDAPGDSAPPAPADLPVIPEVTLLRELARGGMGIVYRGRQDFLERDVAVKLLSPELQGERFAARFRREAKLLAGIKHPYIVACYAAGVAPTGQHYLVMELVEGPTLERWIAENGPVPMRSAVRIASQLASALGQACELGVIHRDIKVANIVLEAANGSTLDPLFPFVPKLVDLGLARMVDGSTDLARTMPGAVMGSPSTMAPEQFDTPDLVDFRADIYGLGCVLFEMLTGKPAYASERLTDLVVMKRQARGPDPSQRVAGVPAPLGELVAAMLAQNPGDRPADYRALRARLDEAARAPNAVVWDPVVSKPADAKSADSKASPGPNLLRTAEFEFLVAAGAESAGAAAAPASAFVSRIIEPTTPVASAAPAPIANVAPAPAPKAETAPSPSEAAPAPVAKAARPVAPPRVIGARPAPPRQHKRNGIIAAAAVALVAAIAVPRWRNVEGSEPTLAEPVAANAVDMVVPETINRRPSVELIGADLPMPRGDRILLRSRAEDADGDTLKYDWSVQPSGAAILSAPNDATTALQHDLLPGDEFKLWLAVRDGRESTGVERRIIVRYEPANLLADFLGADSGWQGMGRVRMPWRQREDGAVVANAGELPIVRTRSMRGPVWRVGGSLLPERGDGRGAGGDVVQGAVSIRLGPQRHLAIVCSREGLRGERFVLSVQQIVRDEGRPGAANILRPLPEAQRPPIEALDAGGASFTLTRRGDELLLQFGFLDRSERVEHIERIRGDVGELSLGLMARGGKVVFGSLLGW